ncbi:hypothetical protein ACH3XW_34005 [Acanthocheilonema viteae]
MHFKSSTANTWPDFESNYTHHTAQFTTKSGTYADKHEEAVIILWITTIIIYLLLIQVAYLINKNLYVWSAVIQAKHLKMLRDREYILLRAYNREMQFSRLMQGIAEDEEYSDNG